MTDHDDCALQGPQFKTLSNELSRMAVLCGLSPILYQSQSFEYQREVMEHFLPWEIHLERGTGRTTRIILLALLAVEAGHYVRFRTLVLRESEWITIEAKRLAAKAGLPVELIRKNVSESQVTLPGFDGLTFRDHGYERPLVTS